ncbi:hypothetical protein GQR58_016706 [Nymphon striatum]|nr:hypothetical protein GQR58_016706 [Nymphon striatum]
MCKHVLDFVCILLMSTSATTFSESDVNPPEFAELKNGELGSLNAMSKDTGESCWSHHTFFNEIFVTENCSVEALLNNIEIAHNDYTNANIVILTDNCEKLKEMESDVAQSLKNKVIIANMPFDCEQNEIFQIITVNTEWKPNEFVMFELENTFPVHQTRQVYFIYDKDTTNQRNENSLEINPAKVVRHFTKEGFSVKMKELRSQNDIKHLIKKLLLVEEETQVYIASKFFRTSKLLKENGYISGSSRMIKSKAKDMAMKSGLFRVKIISWIIFTNEELSKFVDISLEIQYDTRILLLRRKEPQQQSTLTEIYRLAYKAVGKSSSIEMLCSAVIDIWSNLRVADIDGTIWSPEHLIMTGIHFRITLLETSSYVTLYLAALGHVYRSCVNLVLDRYELFEPEDKLYGILQNGQWTGMIGELVHKVWSFFCGAKGTGVSFVPNVWLFIIATIMFCAIILTFIETYQLRQLYKEIDCATDSEVDYSFPKEPRQIF